MEERQRNVKTMIKRIKDSTNNFQEEAMNVLSHKAKNHKVLSWKKITIEGRKIIKECLQQTAEKVQHLETKRQNLFNEAEEYLGNVVERVRVQAVKKVTEMVAHVVQESLRYALKHSAGSKYAPTMESSPKWVTEALMSCFEGFQAKQVSHFLY